MIKNLFFLILTFIFFSFQIVNAKTFKIPNYGDGGGGFNKNVTETVSDLQFQKPILGNEYSDVTNNPLYYPKMLNGSAIVIISACGGIHSRNIDDLKRWNALFLSNGFVTAVVNTTTYPRKKNCGRNKTQSPSRGVKDVYDATRALSTVKGVDKNKIFVIGFSLGAMNAAKSIWSKNAKLALKSNEIIPAAVIGLYGGCKYGQGQVNKTYLFSDLSKPILWLMGGLDREALAKDCAVVNKIKEKNSMSDFFIYKDATHCWDCKNMNGFSKVVGNGNTATYIYNQDITKDSEKRALNFLKKILIKD